MPLLLDTADIDEIGKWLATGAARGVTTNPVLLGRGAPLDPASLYRIAAQVADAAKPLPVSVPVLRFDRAFEEGTALAGQRSNIVVKVPVHDPDGRNLLPVIHQLASTGVAVNATCVLTVAQAVLAAAAGARYVSLLVGRVTDVGGDPFGDITSLVGTLSSLGLQTEVIAASIRGVDSVVSSWRAGAHYVTCKPGILQEMLVNSYGLKTVRSLYAQEP